MEDEAPGVPEWVVTYGDMMSLLLTFFIMLVSLSEVVADKKYRAILDALEQYTGYRTSPAAAPGKSFPLNSLLSSLDRLGSFTNEDIGTGGVKTKSVAGKQLKVFHNREGKRLAVGRMIFFAPGRADLPLDVDRNLTNIVQELAGKPNKIVIRGHASPDPLPSDCRFPDKYTLTYERGRNVMLALEAKGLDHARILISAIGDSQPLPRSEAGSLLRNDRVEVLILDARTTDFIGPRTSQ